MKKLLLFLISFLFFSVVFYFIWIFLKTPYSTILGHSFDVLSRFFDLAFTTEVSERNIIISISDKVIKIDTLFLISNIVVLMALIMSTPGMVMKKKLLSLGPALFLLFMYHILSLYIILIAHGIPDNANQLMLKTRSIFRVVYSFSEQIGKMVMPFIIWLIFSHSYIFIKIGQQNDDGQNDNSKENIISNEDGDRESKTDDSDPPDDEEKITKQESQDISTLESDSDFEGEQEDEKKGLEE